MYVCMYEGMYVEREREREGGGDVTGSGFQMQIWLPQKSTAAVRLLKVEKIQI